MNYFQYIKGLLEKRKIAQLLSVLVLAFVHQPLFAQDSDISITPTSAYFNEVSPGSVSEPVTLTITNHHVSDAITLGPNFFKSSGVGTGTGDEFNILSNDCEGKTLTAETACTFQVQFEPKSEETKHMFLNIDYTKPSGSGQLMAFLSSNENPEHQTKRRLSPVIYDLNIPEEMNAESTYNLSWTVMGYHEGYKTNMVMFDCTGTTSPDCGAVYDSEIIFDESTTLSPAQITSSDWTFRGETSKNYHFTHTYTVPAKRGKQKWGPEGTPFVIRFYVISDEDSIAEKSTLSLIIPGNLSDNYYDTSGRKIQKIICPSDGCTP